MTHFTHVHRVFPTESAAAAVVATVQADDEDGWEYRVVPDPKGTGKAIIAVYDEDGEFITHM